METNEIACSICDKKYPVLDQVEPSERSTWVGPEHQRGEISVVPYNVIRHRIALTNTQDENAGRMVLRELVQNADDAGARILVLRFEDDALYVANDGRAFSTGTRGPNRGDFDRIGEILGGHKREDPDSTGKFGSGFQTVYLITNAPEVHSSGLWAQMDPVNQRMPTRAIGDGGGFITPYASGTESGHTGVVFRLPWRDDDAAETEYGTHGKPFSDSRDFPRWNPQKKVELFDDLVDYSRHVLLCCKTLLTIRLVWDAHGERKACQSRRDFALKGLAGEPRVGTVSAGKLAVEEEWFRWPSIERRDAGARHEWPSFHLKNFRWEGSCSQLRFFIASAPVSTADGRELFIGEDGSKENRELLITQDSTQLRNQAPSMRNDVHLLIPMFDALSQGPDKGFAFHYSTVPLPKRSRNWFAFTGPFFPDESRLDVRIMGLEGEWGRHIVASVGRLYATIFPELVTRAQGLSLEVEEKQSILLNAIPTVPLHQWMRLEEQNGEWARPTQTAIVSLFPSSPIFAFQERWIPPDHARWVTIEGSARNDCSTVLALMHEPVFPERFTTHPSFLGTLAPLLDSRKLTATQFKEIFRQYLSRSGGRLYYGRGHKDHGQHSLTRPDTEALVRFCLTRTERWADLGDLPVVPGRDGILRPLHAYPLLPPNFEDLRDILTPGMSIHPDFVQFLADSGVQTQTVDVEGIVRLVSKIAEQASSHSQGIPREMQEVVSRVLAKIAQSGEFSLNDSHAPLCFIPCLHRGKALLLPPNAKSDGKGSAHVFLGSNRFDPEQYDRSFIFAPEEREQEWLPRESKDATRFLNLVGCTKEQVGPVCQMLHLIDLESKDGPTNFVRHFLSERGGSLFVDENLAKFLDSRDPRLLASQKRTYTRALRAYFDGPKTEKYLKPEDMGKLRCLYDPSREWFPAASFIRETTEASALLGYHSLSSDFHEWPVETLRALGVPLRPEGKILVAKVKEFSGEPKKNRSALAELAILALTAEVTWERELAELAQVRWLPALGGSLESPSRVVLSSPQNRESVGVQFPRFFDASAARQAVRDWLAHCDTHRIEDRAREIGIALSPSVDDLLSVVEDSMRAGGAPPPTVFETLSRQSDLPGNEKLVNVGFYYGKVWFRGNQIIISDDPRLPKLFQGTALVLSPRTAFPVQRYLEGIGATHRPSSAQLIDALTAQSTRSNGGQGNRYDTVLMLWNQLEEALETEGNPFILRPDEVSFEKLLYAVDEKLVPIGNVVLPPAPGEEHPFLRGGWYGDWYVFVNRPLPRHQRSLRNLGAHPISGIGSQEVTALLDSFAQEGTRIASEDAKTVVNLLERIAKDKHPTQFGDSAVWPIRVGQEFRLGSKKGVYIDDLEDSARFRGASLPLLFEGDPPLDDGGLRTLALYQRPPFLRLSQSLLRSLSKVERPGDNDEAQARFSLIGDALSHLTHLGKMPQADFEWLSKVDVLTVAGIEVRVGVQGSEVFALEHPSCFIAVSEGRSKIYMCIEQANLVEDLADALLEQLVPSRPASSTTVRDEARDELRRTLLSLLTEQPSIWNQFQPGLPSFTAHLQPLQSPDIEYKPGYLDTRARLLEEYGVCQICRRKTPASENTFDTCETITSIISKRGGSYWGEFPRYELDNTLFLCPSHQTLFRRGLVRFKSLEGAVASNGRPLGEGASLRAKQLKEMAGQAGGRIEMMVYEVEEQRVREKPGASDKASVEVDRQQSRQEPGWRTVRMRVTDEHASALLRRLAQWLEE